MRSSSRWGGIWGQCRRAIRPETRAISGRNRRMNSAHAPSLLEPTHALMRRSEERVETLSTGRRPSEGGFYNSFVNMLQGLNRQDEGDPGIVEKSYPSSLAAS